MRVVVAPDSFKGVLDAPAAAEAIAAGVRRARPDAEIDVVPMADGGEGTLDCLLAAGGGNRRRVATHGPLGDEVTATVGLIDQAATAVVELAKAAGYGLVPDDKRDPLVTTTYGVGEILRVVCEAEIETVILTVGGSATVDGGAGMMQALGLALHDRAGRVIPPGIAGGQLLDIAEIAWNNPPPGLDAVSFTVAHDVLNPACGPNGAAAVFGPQKGADASAVRCLADGLEHWADLLEPIAGRSVRSEPGTGAAGAVALPLLALLTADLVPGVDVLCEANGLPGRIAGADLVLTGEGCLDGQSRMGKVVGAVGRLAKAVGVPCVALVGTTGPGADRCLDVLDRYVSLDAPIGETAERLTLVAEQVARGDV